MFPTNNEEDSQKVKQRITKKLSRTLRTLQIRYVTTDDKITSDDDDANTLCVTLEAVLVHGLKPKFIKTPPERRNRKNKGRHVPLPQPACWNLLKGITHKNVINELESLNYITTDVGRCRSWLRLALNDSLMECYFISLRRERSQLQEYYQSSALLLDPEDCDVILTYLQGLSSLTFSLSYKSSILNEWTATPLLLCGLWTEESERHELSRKKSLDSVSQSSSSDDTNSSMLSESKCNVQTSSPTMDTNSSSSQLSSSLGSDGQPQTGDSTSPRQPARSEKVLCKEANAERSGRSSAENLVSVVPSNPAPSPRNPFHVDIKPEVPQPNPPSLRGQNKPGVADASKSQNHVPSSRNMGCTVSEVNHTREGASKQTQNGTSNGPKPLSRGNSFHKDTKSHNDIDSAPCAKLLVASKSAESPKPTPNLSITQETPDFYGRQQETEQDGNQEPEQDGNQKPEQNGHQVSSSSSASKLPVQQEETQDKQPTLTASGELPKSKSWITEEDFFICDTGPAKQRPENVCPQLLHSQVPTRSNQAFKVIHRRQTGLANPFRGLLMLGFLERWNALGRYKRYFCELSPGELCLYESEEAQVAQESLSLFRCESVELAQKDGQFELQFSGKKFWFRATSRYEAQDWVDRLQEALEKCRPQQEESWEILNLPEDKMLEKKAGCPFKDGINGIGNMEESAGLDWSCPLKVESDALKESVLYMKIQKNWVRFVFSLSGTCLKCFAPGDSEKVLCSVYRLDTVKDILPDSSLGSPSCFRLVTTKDSLQLQAESPLEAKTWRELVRAYFLDCADDSTSIPEASTYHVKSHIRQHCLYKYLLHIPTEGGLDSQNFMCIGCRNPFGMQTGKHKVCSFSGLYYCDRCHKDESSIIPSRIIHNWDLAERPISTPALNFLTTVRNEPLINVQSLNQRLYQHSHSMDEIRCSREKLRLLGEYLMTCRSGAWQELSKRVDNRTYLLECADMYSVCDLRQIAEGQFKSFLEKLEQFACQHVYNCDLCSQRGFICQICNHNGIIYPFEFETTTRCGDCKAVFHKPCSARGKSCPRCLRRRKYQKQPPHM